MRLLVRIFTFFILTAGCTTSAYAQICTGSLGAPLINFTFGAGNTYGIGPQLDAGITTLKYIADNCGGEDGTYTLLTFMGTTCKGGTWQSIAHDHTGDSNGYMMIINATIDPSLFFTYRVAGSKLCPNTIYQFAAWIMNILRDLPQTQGYSKPNITFSIETTAGKILKTYNTGDIPASDEPVWKQYGTFFTSPADGSDIVVKMINNGNGGFGNDIAMDDITFSPCGPLVQVGFGTLGNTADQNSCLNDNLAYTLVAQQTGYSNPGYLWQVNKNDGSGWVTIPNATSTSYAIDIPKASAGIYQYRIGVLSGPQAGSENCRIYSDPLNVNVFAPPRITVQANTSACVGHPVQLSATGGDNYLWTGPNNFTSTGDSPVVTYNADPGFDGVYTVKISRNNCPSFASTTVKVYPAPTVSPLNNVSICAGDVVQLNATTTNATHFQWSPVEGLDHSDVTNPMAYPKTTTTYNVSVTNDGCNDIAANASVTITVAQLPKANAGGKIKIFEGQTAKLPGTAAGDSVSVFWTPSDYLDNPSSLTPVTSSPDDITYTLHVVSSVNCGESTSSVFVRVYKKLVAANSFTPNGDGINDLWNINNINSYPKARVNIYDRYGQAVFESNGYGKPWDGSQRNSKLPEGTYYYIIDPNEDNLPKQSGWVTIFR